MARRSDGADLAGAALKGAVAGAIGAMAMRAVVEMEERALLAEPLRPQPPEETLVERAGERLGADLSPGQEEAAALGVRLGWGAAWGAVHGVGSEVLGIPPLLHGFLLGGLVYAATRGPGGILPRAGIVPSPMLEPLTEAAIPVGGHLAYGLATAAAYQALR